MLTYSDVEGSQACIEEQAAERAALLVQLASVEGEAEAARLRDQVRRPVVRAWFNRAGGTALIGAGLATAALRRA